MKARDVLLAIVVVFVFGLAVTAIYQDRRITNLEKQLMRVETDYNRVVREAEQLKRMNETSLWLMAQGGWDEVASDIASY